MPEHKESPKDEVRNEKKSILGMVFSKPARDEAYASDLKAQWADLEAAERIKFVIGALIGLILFIGALLLAYFALSALIGKITSSHALSLSMVFYQ